MRFSLVNIAVTATALLAVGTEAASPFASLLLGTLNKDVSSQNHYGAPVPPWVKGAKPGWYYGPKPGKHVPKGIMWLNSHICKWLDIFAHGVIHCPHHYPPSPPFPPPKPTKTPKHTKTRRPTSTSTTTPAHTTAPTPVPTDGYIPTFENYDGAVQADDYMTFGLVETVADCKDMCNSVEGCAFINTYHDNNARGGSTLLTCALFRGCHGIEAADNKGGQTQPDGSVTFITESYGWCNA